MTPANNVPNPTNEMMIFKAEVKSWFSFKSDDALLMKTPRGSEGSIFFLFLIKLLSCFSNYTAPSKPISGLYVIIIEPTLSVPLWIDWTVVYGA